MLSQTPTVWKAASSHKREQVDLIVWIINPYPHCLGKHHITICKPSCVFVFFPLTVNICRNLHPANTQDAGHHHRKATATQFHNFKSSNTTIWLCYVYLKLFQQFGNSAVKTAWNIKKDDKIFSLLTKECNYFCLPLTKHEFYSSYKL